jgi:succinoglycan biosynthesis transport protein ExoP
MQGWSAPPQEPRNIAPPAMGPVSDHTVLTPGDFRKVLIKRKWIIIVGVAIGLAIAIYHVATTVPQFEAIARVHIDLSRTANIGIEDLIQQQLAGGGDTSEKLQTEIQIMQSETVKMEVINSEDLYRKPPFSDIFALRPYSGTLTPAQRSSPWLRGYSVAGISLTPVVSLRFPSSLW